MRLHVSPTRIDFDSLGDSLPIEATVRTGRDKIMERAEFQWTVRDEAVVELRDGEVLSRGNGQTIIEVRSGKLLAEVPVVVSQRVARVEVNPDRATYSALGQERSFQAVGRDKNGHLVSDARFGWSVKDPGVARVDDAGKAKALRRGQSAVEASLIGGTVKGSALLKVEPVPAGLEIRPVPSTWISGRAPGVEVLVVDANGFQVKGSKASVSIKLGKNPVGGTLAGAATVNAVDGLAQLGDVSIAKAGKGYTLAATSARLTGSESNSFEVVAGAPAHLVFKTQPTTTTSQVAINPAVRVEIVDAAGNPRPGNERVTVALGMNGGGGFLAGTLSVNATGGIATFADLSIVRAGSYTLLASSGSLTKESDPFDVGAGPAHHLAFDVHPPSQVIADAPFETTVRVLDRAGNRVTSAADPISLEFAANPVGALLSGGASQAAAAGESTFSQLSIAEVGSGFRLRATAAGLVEATSDPFEVSCGTVREVCGGLCKDTERDDAHCGACDQACVPGAHCDEAACICGDPNLSVCVEGCMDLQFDAANCGTCGSTCTRDCLDAACVFPMEEVSAIPLRLADHSCLLTDDGTGYCWGRNGNGQLGNGQRGTSEGTERFETSPVVLLGAAQQPLLNVAELSLGNAFSCALMAGGESGKVRCWGKNDKAQMGRGSANGNDQIVPAFVRENNQRDLSGVLHVASGGSHACAIVAGGRVRCWGNGEIGQSGDGNHSSNPRTYPVEVGISSHDKLVGATQLALGADHGCANLSNGHVFCWGANSRGQLGDGSTTSRHIAVRVETSSNGALTDVIQIAAHGNNTCALRSDGGVRCWGDNQDGQLGNGMEVDSSSFETRPQTVEISGGPDLQGATMVAVGERHACALLEGGEVRCWGAANRIGDGSSSEQRRPSTVRHSPDRMLTGATHIGAGIDHTCALIQDGTMFCWGDRAWGQVGDGTRGSGGSDARRYAVPVQ